MTQLLQAVVAEDAQRESGKCSDRLRLNGAWCNPKRVHRAYCTLRLPLLRRTRKRAPSRVLRPLLAPERLNESWAIGSMTAMLCDDRRFRTVTVFDEENPEALAIEVSLPLPCVRLIALLEEWIAQHGAPCAIACDDGPERTSSTLITWSKARSVTMPCIQPGKPSQNAFIELFNRTHRHDILDAKDPGTLNEVRDLPTTCLRNDHTRRRHDSLGRRSIRSPTSRASR